ncbi:hypothetical protein [Streptomyces sp. NBC_00286]|uniref:hypothetical protein n=1 Tax=Streptomyces sp. NBC_00286 TaxID=2975701 RepID=UPI002E2D42BA|nr:hypothetical protein [Streptomyces sp. NBC_00286]
MAGHDGERGKQVAGDADGETETETESIHSAHLLLALALGCAAVLAFYAAFPLTDALTEAQSDDFGTAAWFPRVLAVGASVVLVLSMGRRGGAIAAGALAGLAGVVGLVRYLTWTRPEPVWILPPSTELRPAASLALALMCAAVVLLCVPLARRRRPWFGLGEAAAGRAGAVRRRIQQVMVMLIVGSLLGGVLGGAGTLGAALVRGDRETLTLPRQEVHAVPEERWYNGALQTDTPTVWPKGVPSERAWERNFDSPVALSTCERKRGESDEDVYQRGTVVGIDDDLAAEGASVVGVDAGTGEQRWRYTVPTTRHATIHQVGVSEGCAIHVLVDNSLTTLDAFDGSVRGRLLLSSRHRSEQTDLSGQKTNWGWSFITSTRVLWDAKERPTRVVQLPPQDYTFIRDPQQTVLAVRKSNGQAVARGPYDGACGFLTHGSYTAWGQALVVDDCVGRVRSFGVLEYDESERVTPKLYGFPQTSARVPQSCEKGDATAAASSGSTLLVFRSGRRRPCRLIGVVPDLQRRQEGVPVLDGLGQAALLHGHRHKELHPGLRKQ